MTVYLKRPTNRTDWRKVIEKLLSAAPSAAALAGAAATPAAPYAFGASLVGFATNAHKAIRDAVEAAEPGHTVDERAGVWLRVSVTVATLSLLGHREIRSPLGERELKDAVRDFMAGALVFDGDTALDLHTLANPALCPLVAPIRDRLPELVRKVAPEHGLGDGHLKAEFDRLLRAEARRVYALDTSYYGLIDAAMTGPLADDTRRDLAWARHEDWIRGLFHTEPIFAPDDDRPIPLSAVYHRLRCFWDKEAKLDRDREADRRAAPAVREMRRHIADLHELMHDWLRAGPDGDAIRIVAGGPGSGKSSFSRAFAIEVIEAGTHRVIYVQLQHMRWDADLRRRIGDYLHDIWHATTSTGGFEDNPLDWHAGETLPYLLVFDGLDELSHDDDTARDLARKFVRSVQSMLARFPADGPAVRALILGRSAASQEALAEADLDPRHLVKVASLMPIGQASVTMPFLSLSMADDCGRADDDEREQFWERSALARGLSAEPVPEAITASALHELNAEPLLLHLLIVSGYTGENWREVADNRNVVYREIFRAVFERNREKGHPSARSIDEDDFFTLLECLGLAAWRGNGRTGSENDFEALRDLHATGRQRQRFGTLPAAELRNVAIQFYAQPDTHSGGFEFIHKSFGEYLAARGLVQAALRIARLMEQGDDPRSEPEVAAHWAELVAAGEPAEEITRFMVDEARLADSGEIETALVPLTRLFNWTLRYGMPVQGVSPQLKYRELEVLQRCSESMLLCGLDALVRSRRSERRPVVAAVDWGMDPTAPLAFFHRVGATLGWPIGLSIGCLDLRGANLSGADLRRVDLSGADLSGADLERADLSGAKLRRARLCSANLMGARLNNADMYKCNLHQAKLIETDLFQANLKEAILVAHLYRCSLGRASLRCANLSQARLEGTEIESASFADAILEGATLQLPSAYSEVADARALEGASLRFADLSKVTLIEPGALGAAFGVRSGIGTTKLPQGVLAPEHWHEAVGDEGAKDNAEAARAYSLDLSRWRESLRHRDTQ